MNALAGHIGVIMDASLLCLLAATVAVAFRLMKDLREFKDGRAEIRLLVAGLADSIRRAEAAEAAMNAAAVRAIADINTAIAASRKETVRDASKNNAAPEISPASAPTRSTFVILDRAYDDRYHADDVSEDADDGSLQAFESRAERELFDALCRARDAGRAA